MTDPRPVLVALTGPARAGKTTVYDELQWTFDTQWRFDELHKPHQAFMSAATGQPYATIDKDKRIFELNNKTIRHGMVEIDNALKALYGNLCIAELLHQRHYDICTTNVQPLCISSILNQSEYDHLQSIGWRVLLLELVREGCEYGQEINGVKDTRRAIAPDPEAVKVGTSAKLLLNNTGTIADLKHNLYAVVMPAIRSFINKE